jgi:hypothetical protein
MNQNSIVSVHTPSKSRNYIIFTPRANSGAVNKNRVVGDCQCLRNNEDKVVSYAQSGDVDGADK